MSEPVSNAPIRTAEGLSQRMPEAQPVYRELIEILRLEQAFAFAETPERAYNILTMALIKILGHAVNIKEPPAGDPLRKDWASDIAKLRKVEALFASRKMPIPPFPSVEPLTGKDHPEYAVTLNGDTPVSTVLGADMPGFLEVSMRYQLQSAYQTATLPLTGWAEFGHDMLDKYGLLNTVTELVASASITTEGGIDNTLEAAGRYVQGMRDRAAEADEARDDPGDDVDYDSDDDSEESSSSI